VNSSVKARSSSLPCVPGGENLTTRAALAYRPVALPDERNEYCEASRLAPRVKDGSEISRWNEAGSGSVESVASLTDERWSQTETKPSVKGHEEGQSQATKMSHFSMCAYLAKRRQSVGRHRSKRSRTQRPAKPCRRR